MMTAGLMPPVKGSYKLFGMETQSFGEAELAERLRVGFVFEGGQLFNHLTIRENVALPLQYHHDLPFAAAAQEVQTLLDLMELTPLADVTAVEHQRQLAPARGAGAGADPQAGSAVAGQSAGPARRAAFAMVAALS